MAEAVHPMPAGSGDWLVGVKVSDESRSNRPIAQSGVFYQSDAGSLIFPERFLISGLISGAARG